MRSLSWGSDDEVLVGSNSLSLWETSAGKLRTLWRKPLPNPIRLAVFSYDATLVASVGEHDRLVKVWERLSFGSEDVQFGFTYLSHPRAVTNIYWRTPFHREETIESVLYTICVDSVLRIWAPRQGQDQGGLQLWAEINLQETVPAPFTESSIDPEIVSAQEKIEPTPPHYALIIDSRVLKGATEFAMSTAGNSEKQIENKYRLTEIASRNPEICVVFDTTGRMSALGIDNIDTKQKKPSNFFYIVTGESSELVTGLRGTPGEQYLHFLAFSCVKQDSGGLKPVNWFICAKARADVRCV